MTAERVLQLVLIFVLVFLGVWGRAFLVVIDTRRLQGQRKESYTAGVAASTNSTAVAAIVIGIACLLLPWFLASVLVLVPTDFGEIAWLGLELKIPIDFVAYVERFSWIPTYAGWLLIVPSVLYIIFNLSKKIVVEKGSVTFYMFFLPRQTVKVEDITKVKERFCRHRAGVLPVYQCVYDIYAKGEGGEGNKKIYTMANTLGGVRLLRDLAGRNKVEWLNKTPKQYTRNPLIFPDLDQHAIPQGSNRQALYLLTIPCLLTRQMINNNLPEVSGK